jgi:hypothetical protein
MRPLLLIACGLAVATSSCSANDTGSTFQTGGGDLDASNGVDSPPDQFVLPDVSHPDSADAEGGNAYEPDATQDATDCPPGMSQPCDAPIPMGCQAVETCGNGLDDDCNGKADDTCSCTPGAVQSCFLGPPGRVGIGACVAGTQTCQGTAEFGTWGDCVDGLWPVAEVCDGLDNDCNGCVDDGLCCQPPITCPSSADIPEAHPFVPYQLDGKLWYSGPATAWKWDIQGGPCDALLGASYTVAGGNTATPTVNFTLSGDYTVTMTVTTPTGDLSCTFVIHVAGPGLRVELCWEGTGSRDVDLHMMRNDFHQDWCAEDYDCYYLTCKASNWKMQSWGYGNSPIAECSGGPEGDQWIDKGYCSNPRLDIDNIDKPGIPENINVDAPETGQTFRVMVHYYDGSGEPHPMVNIYCDGHRIATYGQAPDFVTGFNDAGGYGCQGSTWRVAEIKTDVSSGSTICDVRALHPPNQNTGYDVRQNTTSYQ